VFKGVVRTSDVPVLFAVGDPYTLTFDVETAKLDDLHDACGAVFLKALGNLTFNSVRAPSAPIRAER
jgi:hypothetical protein